MQVVHHFERHLAQWRQAQPASASRPHAGQRRLSASRAVQPPQQPYPPAGLKKVDLRAPLHCNGIDDSARAGSATSSASSDAGSDAAAVVSAPYSGCSAGGRDSAAATATAGLASGPGSSGRSLGGHDAAAQPTLSSSGCSSLAGRDAAAQPTPSGSGRSLGGRRVADGCGATGGPHVVCVRASSSLMDDMESGWSSGRSLKVDFVYLANFAQCSKPYARMAQLRRASAVSSSCFGFRALLRAKPPP